MQQPKGTRALGKSSSIIPKGSMAKEARESFQPAQADHVEVSVLHLIVCVTMST